MTRIIEAVKKKMFQIIIAAIAIISFTAGWCLGADLNLATGNKRGNYYYSGSVIADQCRNTEVKVNVIETGGSLDNLKRLAKGEVDAAIVQADSLRVFFAENPDQKLVFERTGKLYGEYAHLVCNKASGIKSIKDVDPTKHTILIGEPGSGGHTTWTAFGLQDKSYQKIPTKPVGDIRAVGSVMDGTESQCFMWVSGLNSGFMQKVDEQARGSLVLAEVDDWDFNDMKDEKGKEVYTFTEIPSGTYKKSFQAGVFGGSSVETVMVPAILITSASWIDANPKAYNDFMNGFMSGLPLIWQKVGWDPKK
jgi:TRAP transporter TAXI family solute receptor